MIDHSLDDIYMITVILATAICFICSILGAIIIDILAHIMDKEQDG